MSSAKIPSQLLESIANGQAALIVGTRIGAPSWQKLLHAMSQELRTRGEESAADSVDGLISNKNFVRAASFLGRALGAETCDALLKQEWSQGEGRDEMTRTLAKLPIRQIWTTFPGDSLAQAMSEDSPEGWPKAALKTYLEAGQVNPQKRTLIKLLGDFDSYLATPTSLRGASAKLETLRELVRPFYGKGTIVFLGFEYEDPDFIALLERVFAPFAIPHGNHYWVTPNADVIAVDEVRAEHNIQIIAQDEKQFALTLEAELSQRGVTLSQSKPHGDDLDGWMLRLAEGKDDEEAQAAIDQMARSAEAEGDADRLVDILMARAENEVKAADRAQLLWQTGLIFREKMGDAPKAFTAMSAALAQDPTRTEWLSDIESLAEETRGWGELIADVSDFVADVGDKSLEGFYWAKLGTWYHRRVSRTDYALSSYREGIRVDPRRCELYTGLSAVLRSQEKWGELADLLELRTEDAYASPDEKVDAYLSLGELYEGPLASPRKAIDSYKSVTALSEGAADGLAALERLYKKEERWNALSKVMNQRAELCETTGRNDEAKAIRRELAEVRGDKLGDLEGLIAKHEAALKDNPGDLEALRALEDGYDKAGRHQDYLKVVGALTQHVSGDELSSLLRRYASELEEHPEHHSKALDAWWRLVDLEDSRDDDYRALERLLIEDEDWSALMQAYRKHESIITQPKKRAELCFRMAQIQCHRLDDCKSAAKTLQDALQHDPKHREARELLFSTLRREESWTEALQVATEIAEVESDKSAAEHFVRAGKLAYSRLADSKRATELFEKALDAKPDYVPAFRALSDMYQSENAWQNAIRWLEDGAEATSLRNKKCELLRSAARIALERLGEPEQTREFFERIVQLNPEDLEACAWLAEHYLEVGLVAKATPFLGVIARCSQDSAPADRSSSYSALGHAYRKLGESDKANNAFNHAVEIDPSNLDARIGMIEASVSGLPADDQESWSQAAANFQSLISLQGEGATSAQTTRLWHGLGKAHQKCGELKRAQQAFEKVLSENPKHRASLSSLGNLASSQGDHDQALRCAQKLADLAQGDKRLELLIGLGDLAHEKVGASDVALGAYLEVLDAQPGSRRVLHRLLDLYTQTKDWPKAVETLDAIATYANDSKRRAKYRYASAVICRDELGDKDSALEKFEAALDDHRAIPKAFDASVALYSERGAWKELARAYRRQLQHCADDASNSDLSRWWWDLGLLCRERLQDNQSAIAAWEASLSLDGSVVERNEEVLDAYLEAGKSHRPQAIAVLQRLIGLAPERVELYRMLSSLYQAEGEKDKAYCLAQALVFLDAATDDEKALYHESKPRDLVASERRLTSELWQNAVADRREDRIIGSILSSIMQPLAETSAQPAGSFGLNTAEVDSGHSAAKVFEYARSVFSPLPEARLAIDSKSMSEVVVANTSESGRVVPTVVIGASTADSSTPDELAFQMGQRMAFLRPERYAAFAMASTAKLEDAFYGALSAAEVQIGDSDGRLKDISADLKSRLSPELLEQINASAQKLGLTESNGVIPKWRIAADLTANRAGLILCNDLETAARMVATETNQDGLMSTQEKLQELLAFSVSEEYFSVRKHLGLNVQS